jgi:hypothetical protein
VTAVELSAAEALAVAPRSGNLGLFPLGTVWPNLLKFSGQAVATVDPAVVALGREPTDQERELVAAGISWDELAAVMESLAAAHEQQRQNWGNLSDVLKRESVFRDANRRRQRARVKRRRR